MVQIVAEISGNHGGELNKALEMIDCAADCGCDYAKFQFYRPEDMPDRYGGDNDAMYRRLMVPDEWLPELFKMARRANVGLFASVFSVRAAQTILKFNPPYIKIASPSSTKLPLGTYRGIAARCTPVNRLIISSNRRHWQEMSLLNGLMMYCPRLPITRDDLAIGRTCWGFSDHSSGLAAPLAMLEGSAIRMVEKHFKVDDNCIDAEFSADPDTMATLCSIARHI